MTTETGQNPEEALVKHIAETLNEGNTALIKQVFTLSA